MKQKLLTLALLICTCLQTWADTWTDSNGVTWTYTISGSNTNITECSKTSGSLVIPSKVNGYTVTGIYHYAFQNCSGLTSVTIPSSVIAIGEAAFGGCSGLTSVNIPSSVTYIGNYAFSGCSGLTSVTIPEGVTSIGTAVFSECTGLTGVTIPEGVTSIGYRAFYGCYGLTSVTIPSSVTRIGGYAFDNCSGLTSVNIPSSVTSIGDYAFDNCSGLTSVNIPSSVTSIGDYAFDKCSGLTNVTISSNVILSKDYTYDSNIKHIFGSQVKEYIIGDGVTSIGSYAFRSCSGLTKVTIPSSVTTIGKQAFANCTGLTKVIVPDIAAWCGIYFSDSYANPLSYAKHIYSDENTEIIDLTIPESVTSICFAAFWNCSSLKSVTFPSGLQSIKKSAFKNCRGLTNVTIPEGVTSIGESAFEGCSNITDLKLNCETIENWFADIKTSLKTLTIGEGTTTISDSAFEGFSVLTTVSLGSNVSNIGANAFAQLSKLEDVYCYAIRYPRVDASTFQGSYVEYVTLHVPEVSLQQYKNHAVWGEFFQIVPIDDSSAINDIYSEGNRPEIEAIYDLNGQRQPALHRGINIIKMSDGTIKKVMVK